MDELEKIHKYHSNISSPQIEVKGWTFEEVCTLDFQSSHLNRQHWHENAVQFVRKIVLMLPGLLQVILRLLDLSVNGELERAMEKIFQHFLLKISKREGII
jgi:hypothetical protein